VRALFEKNKVRFARAEQLWYTPSKKLTSWLCFWLLKSFSSACTCIL